MGELLPEFWSRPKDDMTKEAKPRRICKVADIWTWIECFASYVVVRGSLLPEMTAELMAY